MAKVGLRSNPWLVRQWNERLPLPATLTANIPTNLIVASTVAFLLHEPPMHLRRRMPLFEWRLLVPSRELFRALGLGEGH